MPRPGPASASLWLDPDTRVELAVTPESAELTTSHAVLLRVLGLGIQLLAIRYLFGAQRLELEGVPGQPLRNALLRFIAWVASRYLRKRLPAALAEPLGHPLARAQPRPRRSGHRGLLRPAHARAHPGVSGDERERGVHGADRDLG